ncbi:MAG: AI-2E family transporter [Terracidiphilus sp.]
MAMPKRRNFHGDIVFAFALAAAAYVAWLVRGVLVLLYVSALFAVALSPIVRATSQIRLGRWRPFKGAAAIFFLLVALAAVLAAFAYLAFPPVIHDLEGFSSSRATLGPNAVANLRGIPILDHLNTAQLSAQLGAFASHATAYLLLSVKDLAGRLAGIVMGFILTVYFILEGESTYRWLLSFFPLGHRVRLDDALRRAEARMGKWLLGQGSLMLILGVTSTIVYVSLHLRYAYALGVLAGLLNLVPVLGSAVSIALALIVAAFDSWGRVLGVAIFYVVYLQVENSYLTPHIMQTRVQISGLAVIVALLLGFAVAGVVGAMVSVPTAVLVSVLLEEYFVQKDEP